MTLLCSLPLAIIVFVLTPGLAAKADENTRFSKTLSSTEVATAGLAELSSDQVAILDALVRRDIAQSEFVAKTPRAARFSERLSADERRNAGLDVLNDNQRAQLDASVQRLIAPPPTTETSSTASFGTTGRANAASGVRSVKIRRDPEIHGSMTLMVAVGSHDYTAYGGGVVLTYDDPANKFALSVAYSEVRSKGGLYHGGFYYDDYAHGRPFRPFGRGW